MAVLLALDPPSRHNPVLNLTALPTVLGALGLLSLPVHLLVEAITLKPVLSFQFQLDLHVMEPVRKLQRVLHVLPITPVLIARAKYQQRIISVDQDVLQGLQ